jgi:hypothetical protein
MKGKTMKRLYIIVLSILIMSCTASTPTQTATIPVISSSTETATLTAQPTPTPTATLRRPPTATIEPALLTLTPEPWQRPLTVRPEPGDIVFTRFIRPTVGSINGNEVAMYRYDWQNETEELLFSWNPSPYTGPPRFSPDGRYVAFADDDANGAVLIDWQTMERRVVERAPPIEGSYTPGNFVWQPDGDGLYYSSGTPDFYRLMRLEAPFDGEPTIANDAFFAAGENAYSPYPEGTPLLPLRFLTNDLMLVHVGQFGDGLYKITTQDLVILGDEEQPVRLLDFRQNGDVFDIVFTTWYSFDELYTAQMTRQGNITQTQQLDNRVYLAANYLSDGRIVGLVRVSDDVEYLNLPQEGKLLGDEPVVDMITLDDDSIVVIRPNNGAGSVWLFDINDESYTYLSVGARPQIVGR